MTEAKFTKGPWRRHTDYGDMGIGAGDNDEYGPEIRIVGGCGCCGSPYGVEDQEQRDANAHLISAAPDMYEALEQLLGNAEVARFHLHGTEEAEIVSGSLFDTINQARAALAKARGEQ